MLGAGWKENLMNNVGNLSRVERAHERTFFLGLLTASFFTIPAIFRGDSFGYWLSLVGVAALVALALGWHKRMTSATTKVEMMWATYFLTLLIPTLMIIVSLMMVTINGVALYFRVPDPSAVPSMIGAIIAAGLSVALVVINLRVLFGKNSKE
jgi:hypothetical protein